MLVVEWIYISYELYQLSKYQYVIFLWHIQKSTKSSLETARTFATLFLDIDFRHQLLLAESEYEFKQLLHTRTKLLIEEQGLPENRKSHLVLSAFEQEEQEVCV